MSPHIISELTKMAIFGLLESQVEFPIMSRILVDFPWLWGRLRLHSSSISGGEFQPIETL